MSKQIHIHIKLQDFLELVFLGVRRAVAFMALGLHAANDPQAKSLNLDSNFKMLFFPEDMPSAALAEAKANFSEWIVGNGLRELEQHFCVFLDGLYRACLLISSKGRVSTGYKRRLQRMTDDTSLNGKLRRLADDFSIVSTCDSHLSSVSKARNAIAHALGFVRDRDCNCPDGLRVTWRTRDVILAGRVLNPGFEPFVIDEGPADLELKIIDRERVFAVGTRVLLSPVDLTEICVMFRDEAQRLVSAVAALARVHGIPATAADAGSKPPPA